MNHLVEKVAAYVNQLMDLQLSPDLKFHNKGHTMDVVTAVNQLGAFCGLNKPELEKLQVAAWFHDTGYCYTYLGHEENSEALAINFLKSVNCSEGYISAIVSIINATKVPQKPASLLEEIICDADLAHLAKPDYSLYEQRLRKEWELCLNRTYTDQEWDHENLDLMLHHRYFTDYGKRELEMGKLRNASLIALRLRGQL